MSKNKGCNRRLGLCLLVLSGLLAAFPASSFAAGTWAPLTNFAPNFTGTMLLLSDGTVMVLSAADTQTWFKLTPDIHGSYLNGTWTTLAPMSISRLYFASEVLPSGKVWVLGGEYTGGVQNIAATGEQYDPIANTWSPIASYPTTPACPVTACFGDDPSMLIPGGKIIAGDIFTNAPHIYNIATNSWSPGPSKVYNDRSDEEGWTKLSNGNVLTYDLFQSIATGNGYAEVYNPATNSWSSISPSDGSAGGTLPVLSSNALGEELGPVMHLQDGRAMVIGANQHTALYNPTTNSWAAGPDTPGNFGADDAPAAELPNGHVIYSADNAPNVGAPFQKPTHIFEFDPVAGTTTDITASLPDANLASIPSYPTRMLTLPTGQVLFVDSSVRLWIYTEAGAPNPALRPVVNNTVYNGGGVFTLTGKQLNGQSGGSAYGDDVESDENFPIVRLSTFTGNVYYCRTTNWSTVGIDGGSALETVNFTLNPGIIAGNYSMTVIGAGISSYPIAINITQNEVNGL